MKTMLRLEVAPKCGIYANSSFYSQPDIYDAIEKTRAIIEYHFKNVNNPRHPTPLSDTLFASNLALNGVERDEVYYGFIDEAQFRAWFPNDDILHEFHDVGVTLVCYEHAFRIDGNAQCAMPNLNTEKWRISLARYLEYGIPLDE